MEGYRPAIARRWLGGIVILLAGAVCLAAVARLAIRIHWDPALAALAGQPHAPDFGVFLGAADDVLHGRSPYAGPFPGGGDFGYVYPPLLAVLMSPLALVPTQAVASWGPFLLACILGSLMILGVRDWRCYAIAAVSPFTRSALEYGAIGPVLVLLVALTWRFRDDELRAAVGASLALAAKLFLWPMAVWLAVTGRARTAGLTVAFALLLVLGSWAVIGFAGLTGYPALLGKVQDQAGSSYSPTALFMALGFSSGVSKALSAALGAFFVGLAVHVARDPGRAKADRDRRALTASLAASLALTPVVWLHYFVVLLIPIALARPRFSAVWLALLATTALDLVGTFRASPDGDLAPLALVTAIWLGVVVWCLVSTPEVDSVAQSRDVSQLASRDGQASPASPGRQE